MAVIHSYQELIVWQKAIDLVVLVYKYTEDLPKSEVYGLMSQMRRSAVSIPSNIAEGRRRGTINDYRQFLLIAFGSGAELETQLIISDKLDYGNKNLLEKCNALLNEIMRILNSMTLNIKTSQNSSKKLQANQLIS